MTPRADGLRIRAGSAADRAFVLEAVKRLADFELPPWRSNPEVVEGEARTLRAFFERPPAGSALLIAESPEGSPLGFAYLETLSDYFTQERHGHIAILAVEKRAEGKGVGGALLRAAEVWTRGLGYRRLTLAVFEGNRRARTVYERGGFAPEVLRYVKMLDGGGPA